MDEHYTYYIYYKLKVNFDYYIFVKNALKLIYQHHEMD